MTHFIDCLIIIKAQQLNQAMNNKPSTSSSQRTLKQNQYTFNIDSLRHIQISSNFENGNISLVKQIHELYYVLESVADIDNTQSKKSWFYFKMKSVKGIKVRIIIQNVAIYQNIFEDKLHCKPYCRQGVNGVWQQASEAFLTFRDEVVLVIDHTFANQQEIYFCMTIPYTYTDNQQFLQRIKSYIHHQVSYTDEILTQTCQKRKVHLLTITQQSNKKNRNSEEKKPIVLITSRVHPGQVSASYVLQGMLRFLLSHNNLQAYLLRKLFTFKIIPMVNPDGVVQGNYRMDTQGFNLNRFYQNPSAEQHPAIFHITELMKKLSASHKIEFYFDLHSHSAIKEAFIYGNAFEDLVNQTYSQLFCKILQENYSRFRTSLSNFGEKQMKFKDKGELLSKQGCGRVVISKLYGVVQSYTLQSSIFPAAYTFPCRPNKNEQKNKQFSSSIHSQIYQFVPIGETDYTQNIMVCQNKKLGRSILISILDMIRKNPYTRLSEDFNDNYCKDLALRLFQNEERFKLIDTKAYQKCKMITQSIKQNIEDKLERQWNMCGIHLEVNAMNLPKEFRKIGIFEDIPLLREKQNKSKRFKTEQREKLISKSLSKAKKQIRSHLKIVGNNGESYRSISPKENDQALFPEIKYSIQLKSVKSKESHQVKAATIKQMKLDITQGSAIIYEGDKIKKKIILQYIQDEITKINPDKQMFKRSNVSLNRLIANKIIEKEKAKNKNIQISEYQKIILESRKRIATQCRQGFDGVEVKVFKEKLHSQGDEQMKGLQLKKAEMVKKRFITTNKAIEFIKRNDKTKVKLPDLNKLSLVVQNSKKERERLFLEEPHLKIHSQNNVQ